MSNSTPVEEATTGTTATPTANSPVVRDENNSNLVTDHGRTSVADVVVSKIAGMAAREVTGVHGLGGSTARALGALRERIPGGRVNVQQGISVEVGERQAAVDISIVAEYGVAIHELAEAIRRNIIISVEEMTGLEVTEVNVTVHDVHLPGDDENNGDDAEPEKAPRVQ
ncbi:Asp23/Gls24 family envelope stress response protein [uncultured Corynebacterium sp.]|uniref:Asp23/Gls24 family envelope stress response protein n=1 Tax=uncultured Corynebacterium sp. TaxID=159447 RepID=UPI0025E9C073|nr:Asp23/Gls24 family envelope stress response protein [uncultured Corynebacterium sp.]